LPRARTVHVRKYILEPQIIHGKIMTNPSFTILVIEAEVRIRRFLRTSLASDDYHLEEAETSQDGLLKAAIHRPDLIILDLDLPHMDGVEITKQLRKWTNMPIIVLSAHRQEDYKIAALDAGADDYITKPLSTGELLARLRAVLRRTIRAASTTTHFVFHVGDLHVDLTRRQVWVGKREIHLTPIEYKLLIILVQHAGTVLTHRQLLCTIWGPDYAQANHYLRVYMGMLRRKLEADPTRPRYLHTEPTVGYRLTVE
jgi:two-component system KDP operon response regulator KdpE